MNIIVFGARGTIGSRVCSDLKRRGHLVQGATLNQLGKGQEVLTFSRAIDLIRQKRFDLVINASGPRPGISELDIRSWWVEDLASAIADVKVKGILLSTIRVTDGGSSPIIEGAPARPLTDYALINSRYEEIWLNPESPVLSVIRAVNVLLVPTQRETTQMSLLPWSLVEQAFQNGYIDVKEPTATREFISVPDLVSGLLLVSAREENPPIVETRQGLTLTISEIASLVASLMKIPIRASTSPSSPAQSSPFTVNESTWLVKNGWKPEISRAIVADYLTQYLANLEA